MEKNKIIVLQGPPASGKSTWAREIAKAGTPYVIVSRDAIRLARGDYWIPEQEDYISKLEEYAVISALERNLIPIIDATNLNPKTIKKWEDLASEYNCEIEYKQFYVPFKEALERDTNRTLSVGKKVLKNFYTKYFYEEFVKEVGYDNRPIIEPNQLPNCVIIDLDGTVALHQGRLPYDWDKIPTDKCDPRMKNIIEQFVSQSVSIIFLTGRPESARKLTNEWLHTHFPTLNYKLFMRDNKDFRSGEIYKKMMWKSHIELNYNTLCVFEDSNMFI